MSAHGLEAVVGNRHIIEFLRKNAAGGRAAHAYLFTGPPGIGKAFAARALAAFLLDTDRPEQHPDFHLVERSVDAKTGKPHAAILAEQIEELVGQAARSALLAGRQIFVIDGADRLNPAAANALLKTLEEPKGSTVIVLLAPSSGSVLPTISSRCQPLEFRLVQSADIIAALEKEGVPTGQATLFARLSGGRPGRALELARDPAAFRALRETRETALRFLESGLTERFEAAGKLLPPKLAFADAAEKGRGFFDLLAELLRDAFAAANGLDRNLIHADVAERLALIGRDKPGLAAVRSALEAYPKSRRLIDENVGARTALERFASAF